MPYSTLRCSYSAASERCSRHPPVWGEVCRTRRQQQHFVELTNLKALSKFYTATKTLSPNTILLLSRSAVAFEWTSLASSRQPVGPQTMDKGVLKDAAWAAARGLFWDLIGE